MKYAGIAALCLMLLACQGNTQEKAQLKTQKDSVSYAIGHDIAKNLKKQSFDIDPDLLAKGLKDILNDVKPALDDSQSQAAIMSYQKHMMDVQAEKNKTAGDAFLAENKKKDGVITLPSGLQYKVEKMGTGKKPKAEETVAVHYIGKLVDGTEFDNSYKRGQPASFQVNGVVRGWTEALQLMPVGSKWTLFIPPDLAYGERGAGQVIPPNATLIFEVELLSVK
ncbi:MAG: FKBP-type peptidyl-prolyl cis-trans isomerase [Bacteroidota bacterium]